MNATFWLCCGLRSAAFHYHLCSLMVKNRRSHRYNHDILLNIGQIQAVIKLTEVYTVWCIFIFVCLQGHPHYKSGFFFGTVQLVTAKSCLLASYQMCVIKKRVVRHRHEHTSGNAEWKQRASPSHRLNLSGRGTRVLPCDAVQFRGTNTVPTWKCSQQGPWIIASIRVMISRKSVGF